MHVQVRPARLADAAALAAVVTENRDFLAPWEPTRAAASYTEAGQRAELEQALALAEKGSALPCVILVDGEPVGRANVSDVVRGAFHSAHLGYWVAERVNGQGVATRAVGDVTRLAFAELGLHRLQAATLVHNLASRKVLARNGFTEIGRASQYLRIAGRWQDHLLHQLIDRSWTGSY